MKFTMPRVQDERKKKKKKNSASCGIFVVLLMLGMVVVVTGDDPFTFMAGESGVRGTSIISSPAVPSKIVCAAVCHSESSCLGFNWISKKKICETLFSLREVNVDPLNTIYVPDLNAVHWEYLSYACPSCYGSPPSAPQVWQHNCKLNGYVIGVAASSSFNDLDYLMCVNPPGLQLDSNPSQGLTVKESANRYCTMEPNYLMNAAWSNHQNYSSPSQFRSVCRLLVSSHRIDAQRCTNALEFTGHFPSKRDSAYHIMQCPPHMAAVGLMMMPGEPATVHCCLIYEM